MGTIKEQALNWARLIVEQTYREKGAQEGLAVLQAFCRLAQVAGFALDRTKFEQECQPDLCLKRTKGDSICERRFSHGGDCSADPDRVRT